MTTAIRTSICCLLLFCVPLMANADAGQWRTEMGYRFLNNTDELKDICEHISENAGKGGDVHNASINLNIQPYRQFDNGFQIGAGIGPFVLIAGDTWHLLVPMNVTLGWAFFTRSPVSPYVKAGISYHFSDGEYEAGSTPGVYTGIGIRLFNMKALKLGVEIAYDSARIELYDGLERKEHALHTGELTLGVFADF